MTIAKCRICGKKIERNLAYKVQRKGMNEYYCSQEEYNHAVKEKSCKLNICSILGGVLNNNVSYTLLLKEINTITEKHSCSKVLHYIQDNKDYLEQLVRNKTFSSNYRSVRYLFTVITNNIVQYQYNEPEPIVLNDELFESQYKPKPHKASLSDYE